MQTSVPQVSCQPARRHHTALVSTPWDHQRPVEVDGFVPERAEPDPTDGRAALCFDAGQFSLTLRPTPSDLRRLATMCHALADELECAANAQRCTRQMEAA